MFAHYQKFDYPDASKINSKLYEIVLQNINGPVMGGGSRTDCTLHTKGIREVDTLLSWMKDILTNVAFGFANDGEDVPLVPTDVGFDITSFVIDSCWGIHYNKGQKVVKHNHFPYSMAYVYCVNAPDKSSPFIIEGERIQSIPGRVIFFLPHQYHGTLPSKVDGRCMLVGNILYTPPSATFGGK